MKKETKPTTYFQVDLQPDSNALALLRAIQVHLRVLEFYSLPMHRRKAFEKRKALPYVPYSAALEFAFKLLADSATLQNLHVFSDVYPAEAGKG
jgi:hypothetical protein